jgi:plasmid replication protein
MSASGLYNYFTHAENPEKTKYDPNDIESGCGFDRKKFLLENDYESLLAYALDIIDTMGFTEFGSLVSYARKNDPDLLRLIIQKTYFFSRLLDSMRYSKREEQFKDLEKSKLLMQPKKNNKKRDGDLDR